MMLKISLVRYNKVSKEVIDLIIDLENYLLVMYHDKILTIIKRIKPVIFEKEPANTALYDSNTGKDWSYSIYLENPHYLEGFLKVLSN